MFARKSRATFALAAHASLSLTIAGVAFACGPLGCATYQSDLNRAQRAFEDNQHERALSIFRGLDPDIDRLSPQERTRYFYLRGMTDYRMGYKLDARHYLALARASELQYPGSLPNDWVKRMSDAASELNEEVFIGGVQSLSNTRAAKPIDEPSQRRKKPIADDEI